jgi:mannose-6-phosphate isomerase-like protein (cupin superfamily)
MKAGWIGLLLVLPLIGAEPAGYKYWSAADLRAQGKALAFKMNALKVATDRGPEFGNHYAMLAHREGSGEAEYHESEADLFVVQTGMATLVVGGKLANGKTTAPGEIRGPSIDGGAKQRISAGDIVHIPSKTPHQVLLDAGKEFNYFVLKIKE